MAVVVSGDGSEGLQDEVDGRVELLLQPLQLQDAGVRRLAVEGQHLLQRVDHILGAADQSLETRRPRVEGKRWRSVRNEWLVMEEKKRRRRKCQPGTMAGVWMLDSNSVTSFSALEASLAISRL